MLHPSLHHAVPAARAAGTARVTLVNGRVLWPPQPAVDVAHRVLAGFDLLGLLDGEQPALAAGTIGAVVGAGAADEEAWVSLDVDPGAYLSVTDVVEVFRRIGGDGVDTLGGKREREAGEICEICIIIHKRGMSQHTVIGIASVSQVMSGIKTLAPAD